MSEKAKRDEAKQKTAKGHEIPVLKRSEFFRNLDKVAKTTDSVTKRRPKQ